MRAVRRRPSPNFGARRHGLPPDLVVIHYTGMESCAAALKRLCDPDAAVSAHFLIDESGLVYALVPEEMRAWHAGAGSWGAVTDVNSHSIGIELANTGRRPFAEPQICALEELLFQVIKRWHIPRERVIGHADMAPERKDDPGVYFDWNRLARAGLSVWPEEAQPADGGHAAFFDHARRFGYPDAPGARLLAVFRARFRPFEEGPLDCFDVGIAAQLARRFPVDRADTDT